MSEKQPPTKEQLDKIVVGHITQVEQHPDADKLKVCMVTVKKTFVGYVDPVAFEEGKVQALEDVPKDTKGLDELYDTEQLQIICGASNVRELVYVPVALHNARLPDGTKIKKSKMRGVQSMGMICSLAELGFEEKSDGIHIFGTHRSYAQENSVGNGMIYDFVGQPALQFIEQSMS